MAKIYDIITNPNPVLRRKSPEIAKEKIASAELKEFCADLAETMIAKDGIGLAAPQVGENIRLAVINTDEGPLCLINPKMKRKSWTKVWGEEGCLSVPGLYGEVKRRKKLKCKYFNQAGEEITIEAEGLFARVIQHEIDHLDGVLFIDKMRPLKNKKEAKKI